ncbi:hypothetical protein ACJX0J_020100, partial [Zea mays]
MSCAYCTIDSAQLDLEDVEEDDEEEEGVLEDAIPQDLLLELPEIRAIDIHIDHLNVFVGRTELSGSGAEIRMGTSSAEIPMGASGAEIPMGVLASRLETAYRNIKSTFVCGDKVEALLRM